MRGSQPEHDARGPSECMMDAASNCASDASETPGVEQLSPVLQIHRGHLSENGDAGAPLATCAGFSTAAKHWARRSWRNTSSTVGRTMCLPLESHLKASFLWRKLTASRRLLAGPHALAAMRLLCMAQAQRISLMRLNGALSQWRQTGAPWSRPQRYPLLKESLKGYDSSLLLWGVSTMLADVPPGS